MKPTKILLYSPFYYPETISTGKYNTALVRALVERDAEVEVIASHPLYPTWKPVRAGDHVEGTPVHRGGAWVPYSRRPILRRLALEAWFAWHAAWQTLRRRKDTARVVAVFPPSLFFVFAHLLLPSWVRRVGIVHDLQASMGLNGSGLLKRLLHRLVHAVEGWSFRACDHLVVLSYGMAKKCVSDFGVDSAKVSVHYPFVTVKPNGSAGTNLAALLPDSVPHVVYSGALGQKQNSVHLLEFFREASRGLPGVHFHIFSAGPTFDELCNAHAAAPAERVHFHDLVPEADLEELYARSTVQVLSQSDTSSNACMPSKLPNILASGCPVLAICESGSEVWGLLEQTGTGMTGEYGEGDLVDKLKQLLERAPTHDHAELQRRTADLLARQFNLTALVDAVLEEPGRKAAGHVAAFEKVAAD